MVEELGADAYVYGRTTTGDEEHLATVRVDGRRPPVAGGVVHVTPRPGNVHLVDTRTGAHLGG